MTPEARLILWLLTWAAACALLLVRHWRNALGVGLVFTYVLSASAIHFLGAAMYALPWYSTPLFEPTLGGFEVSTLGLLGFVAGGEMAAAVFRRRQADRPPATPGTVPPLLVATYFGVGTLFYGVVYPLVSSLPTVAAVASAASSLMVVGVALWAWNAWQRGQVGACWGWLAASGAFPLVTLVVQGFLGYGFAAMVLVAAFVASFYRPRWQVAVVGLIVAYAGLSVYVTYMRDRRDIRAVVWGGEAMGSRLERLGATFADTEWFNLSDVDHVKRIDDRLNQNTLIGAAVDGIESGAVEPGHGATLAEAALALVPRAIWPDKPVVAGSGDLVASYTGMTFAEGTSVGIGHMMEWYVNFERPGVVFGLMAIGFLVVLVDRSAALALYRGDVARFTQWFLPGMSLLQVGGSFAELTSSAAAAFVAVALINRVVGAAALQPARPGLTRPGAPASERP